MFMGDVLFCCEGKLDEIWFYYCWVIYYYSIVNMLKKGNN